MIVQSEEIDYCGIIILLRQLVQAGKWEKMIPYIRRIHKRSSCSMAAKK